MLSISQFQWQFGLFITAKCAKGVNILVCIKFGLWTTVLAGVLILFHFHLVTCKVATVSMYIGLVAIVNLQICP